ncbi:MAG: twin-arginine translocase TatA/TatE family subunit [Archangium sp.]|nr:twin-arginine translocase TatA/TatE family subunit [Archangium sp.]
MFNIGSGEIALIAVVALLILGPSRLPELARGIGKFMREFRRQTDEVRGVVEREFYKMDAELKIPDQLEVRPAKDTEPNRQQPTAARDDAERSGESAEVRRPGSSVPKNPYPTPSEEEAMALPTDHVHSQLTAGAPESTPVVPSGVGGPAPIIPSGVEGASTTEPSPAAPPDVTPKS